MCGELSRRGTLPFQSRSPWTVTGSAEAIRHACDNLPHCKVAAINSNVEHWHAGRPHPAK